MEWVLVVFLLLPHTPPYLSTQLPQLSLLSLSTLNSESRWTDGMRSTTEASFNPTYIFWATSLLIYNSHCVYKKERERERAEHITETIPAEIYKKKVKEAKEKVQKSTRVRIIPHFICASRGTKILSSAKKKKHERHSRNGYIKDTQRKIHYKIN